MRRWHSEALRQRSICMNATIQLSSLCDQDNISAQLAGASGNNCNVFCLVARHFNFSSTINADKLLHPHSPVQQLLLPILLSGRSVQFMKRSFILMHLPDKPFSNHAVKSLTLAPASCSQENCLKNLV